MSQGPLVVLLHCPLPLVVRVVKRAKEMGAVEERWPYPQWRDDRHSMRFVFADVNVGETYLKEATGMIGQWEDENEPED